MTTIKQILKNYLKDLKDQLKKTEKQNKNNRKVNYIDLDLHSKIGDLEERIYFLKNDLKFKK